MGGNNVSPTPAQTNTTYSAESAKAGMAQMAAITAQLGIGTFLTVDELFALAEKQLRESDGQIRAMLADVQAKRARSGELAEIVAALRGAKGKTHEEQQAVIDQALAKAQSSGDAETVAKLQALKDQITPGAGDGAWTVGEKMKPMSNEMIESRVQEMEQWANDATSSVDLSMIKIQGLMQQRSQVLTFVSNAISAINEAAKNTIGNMRG